MNTITVGGTWINRRGVTVEIVMISGAFVIVAHGDDESTCRLSDFLATHVPAA